MVRLATRLAVSYVLLNLKFPRTKRATAIQYWQFQVAAISNIQSIPFSLPHYHLETVLLRPELLLHASTSVYSAFQWNKAIGRRTVIFFSRIHFSIAPLRLKACMSQEDAATLSKYDASMTKSRKERLTTINIVDGQL